jgi:tRNA dimethylallyltransferase
MLPEPFQNTHVLTGPTASGKTALAIEIAQRMDAEIVSMDSMAVYRGMDIGTAKPTADERRRVFHHLIDVLDPWDAGSVAWWLQLAGECVREIESRGKRALIVGGTPMYLKALVYGLFEGPPADIGLRKRLSAEAETCGTAVLHARLCELDPPAAKRIHANDGRRIIRALEVWELTGKPISIHQQQWEQTPDLRADRVLCLDVPRQELYARIDSRVRNMIVDGLVDEVRRLRSLPRGLGKEARQAVGYKEILEHLDGAVSLDDAVVRIQTRTRQFAKRQLTWFRHLAPCQMVRTEKVRDLWVSKAH